MVTVSEHLKRRGITFEVVPHQRTYTSIDEARALGISADEVVKTVVLDTAAGHALAVIPASRRIDMKQVRTATGDTHVRFASEDELERDFPDIQLGAFPPLGSLHGIPTYVDPEVMEHGTVVFAAGSQNESVKVRAADLFRDEPISTTPLTKYTGAE